MEKDEKGRCGNMSQEQKDILYKYMEDNPDFRQAKFSGTFTQKMAQQKWEEIGAQLNQTVGVIKNWKAWRKTWQDLCSRAKQKKSRINNSQKATGGGPGTVEILTPFEEKLVHLIGNTAIGGHTEVLESDVINFLDDSTSAPAKNQTYQPAGNTEMVDMELYVHEPTSTRHNTTPAEDQLPTPNIQPTESDYGVHETPTSRNSLLGKRASNNNENIPPEQRTLSVKRLEHTLQAQENITQQLGEKNRLKKDYYERKLALYERLIIAKEEYYKRCNSESNE